MSSIFFSFLFSIDDWEILFIFYFRYETAAILVNLSIFCTCTIALKGTTAFVSRVHNMMKNQRKNRDIRQRVISLCERYSVIYDSLSRVFARKAVNRTFALLRLQIFVDTAIREGQYFTENSTPTCRLIWEIYNVWHCLLIVFNCKMFELQRISHGYVYSWLSLIA